jgi:hypothetical protein
MIFTLCDIEIAVRQSFARDTCSPDDLNEWSQDNQSRGHCAVTALTLEAMLGGELLCAEVHVGHALVGYHWWNRIGAVEIDLTRDQFATQEIVGPPWLAELPRTTDEHGVSRVRNDHIYAEQYSLFSERVLNALEQATIL